MTATDSLSASDVKRSKPEYQLTQDCNRALCPRCAGLWGYRYFDGLLATGRALAEHDAVAYRYRLTTSVATDVSLADQLEAVLKAFTAVQGGEQYEMDRKTHGIYGMARAIHEAVLPTGLRFHAEALLWTEAELAHPEVVLDRLYGRWSRTLHRQGIPSAREDQLIWRARNFEGESHFLCSKGLSTTFGVQEDLTPEMEDTFGSLAAADWSVRERASQPGTWDVVVPTRAAGGGAKPLVYEPVHELVGRDVPEPVTRLWRLERAWADRKRVARTNWADDGRDQRLNELRAVWRSAVPLPRAPVRLRSEDLAVAETGFEILTQEDLDLFLTDPRFTAWLEASSAAEADWENFWLRRGGASPRSHRRATQAPGRPTGGASDAR